MNEKKSKNNDYNHPQCKECNVYYSKKQPEQGPKHHGKANPMDVLKY
jgi:hypothetical protein